jgi:hypothetical protein
MTDMRSNWHPKTKDSLKPHPKFKRVSLVIVFLSFRKDPFRFHFTDW